MQNQNFNLKINLDVCVRCGGCTLKYPEIFGFNDDGNIYVKKDTYPSLIQEIKSICPVNAIIESI